MFAVISGSVQFGIMQRDKATHVTFGKSSDLQTTFIFHMLRFLSGVHMFYALALFWSIPMCVMLMVGYSMIEYQGKLWDIWLLSVERTISFASPPKYTSIMNKLQLLLSFTILLL